jgi:hypothetical protein
MRAINARRGTAKGLRIYCRKLEGYEGRTPFRIKLKAEADVTTINNGRT